MDWTACDILDECVSCQKQLLNLYNSAASEAAGSRLRSQLRHLLDEEHELHTQVFQVMERRGLYQPHLAQAREISQARDKYSR